MVNAQISVEHTVSCSWDSGITSKILEFGDKNDADQWDEEGGLVHHVLEENFVYLEKTNEVVPCTVSIKINDPFSQITNVSVVSEAHIFEIYGKYGEYIKTCKCDLITEANGIKVYGAQPSLLTTHEVSFKFPALKQGFWLYGIKILVHKISSNNSTFDYNLIDDKLQSSGIQITEKAEKFKKFLQEYAANKCSTTKTIDPQMLLKIMEGECMAHLRPLSNKSKNISKYLSGLIPNSLKDNNSSGDRSDEDKPPEASRSPEHPTSTMKNYVDESLQKLECRLQQTFKKQLEDLEAKQNEKLDTILELLKNSALR